MTLRYSLQQAQADSSKQEQLTVPTEVNLAKKIETRLNEQLADYPYASKWVVALNVDGKLMDPEFAKQLIEGVKYQTDDSLVGVPSESSSIHQLYSAINARLTGEVRISSVSVASMDKNINAHEDSFEPFVCTEMDLTQTGVEKLLYALNKAHSGLDTEDQYEMAKPGIIAGHRGQAIDPAKNRFRIMVTFEEMHTNFISGSHHEGQMKTQELVLYPTLLTLLPTIPNLRCLDAGCGEGTVSKFIGQQRSSWTLTAGDLPGVSLEKAKLALAGSADVRELDLRERLPITDNSQDVIVTICTLMWLNDDEFVRAASEIRRIISDSGKLVIIDVHPEWQAHKLPSGWPADDRTTPVSDSWNDGAITVWWRSQETYEANLERSGFRSLTKAINIPDGLDLLPRYQEKVGSPLCLAIEAYPA